MERDIIILYGLSRGWGDVDASRKAHCRLDSARTRRQFLFDHPWEIFRLPVLHMTPSTYRCWVCGTHMRTRFPDAARRHVARHFLAREFIQHHGVISEDERFEREQDKARR